MKRFLKRGCLFFGILLVFAFIIDYMVSKGLQKTECFSYQVYNDIVTGQLKSDVVFMGNSRALSHFNPKIIDSICDVDSYNLGIGGYPVNAQIAGYHCYKAHNKLPQVLVYQVDFFTLRILHDVRHHHNSERFFPTIYDKTMRKELSNMGYGFFELCCPLYRYFGYSEIARIGLMEFLNISHYVDMPAYKGFWPEEGTWDGTKASQIDSINSAFDIDARILFEDFLEECKNDSIIVLLVNSPYYSQTLRKIKNLNKMNDYYDSIAHKYGWQYLNYTENYDICDDTLNFSISAHLTPKAANMFSTRFAHDLDSLKVVSKRP